MSISLMAASTLLARSQSPTWAEDVAPILFNNCTNCHNSNGIGPMPLETYQQAYDFSGQIKVAVMTQKMPPWPPDKNYRSFAHERALSPAQIQTIADWVDAGSNPGNLANAPSLPVYSAYELTQNDLELSIPTYTVNAAQDLYRCFVIPVGNNIDKFIKDIEIIPGNRSIVHHVLVFQDPTQTPVNLDNNDPGPGYTSFGGTGSNASKLIGGWVPGGRAFRFPNQMGPKLEANTNIILQIHYPAGSFNVQDSTRIRIKYQSGAVREVNIDPPINHFNLENGPLYIPANATKWFYSSYSVPAQYDLSVLNVAPHMHLIGKKIKVYGITPAQDTIPVIKIDDWDFHWQGFYAFKNLLKIPGGTTVRAEAYYDNTAANHHNPNIPPQAVSAGEATTDEMMVVYFSYTMYMPGDENISQELPVNTTSVAETDFQDFIKGIQFYDIYPNPTQDYIHISLALPHKGILQTRMYTMDGKSVYSSTPSEISGLVNESISVQNLPAGIYVVEVSHGGITKQKKFIKH